MITELVSELVTSSSVVSNRAFDIEQLFPSSTDHVKLIPFLTRWAELIYRSYKEGYSSHFTCYWQFGSYTTTNQYIVTTSNNSYSYDFDLTY